MLRDGFANLAYSVSSAEYAICLGPQASCALPRVVVRSLCRERASELLRTAAIAGCADGGVSISGRHIA